LRVICENVAMRSLVGCSTRWIRADGEEEEEPAEVTGLRACYDAVDLSLAEQRMLNELRGHDGGEVRAYFSEP
jgi:hypothetical protein